MQSMYDEGTTDLAQRSARVDCGDASTPEAVDRWMVVRSRDSRRQRRTNRRCGRRSAGVAHTTRRRDDRDHARCYRAWKPQCVQLRLWRPPSSCICARLSPRLHIHAYGRRRRIATCSRIHLRGSRRRGAIVEAITTSASERRPESEDSLGLPRYLLRKMNTGSVATSSFCPAPNRRDIGNSSVCSSSNPAARAASTVHSPSG